MHFTWNWTSRLPADTSSPATHLSWCIPAVEISALLSHRLQCLLSWWIYSVVRLFMTWPVATSPLTLFPCQLQKQSGSSSHPSWHLLHISQWEVLPRTAPRSLCWLGTAPVWDPVWDCCQAYLICRGFLPEARPKEFSVLISEWDFLSDFLPEEAI